MDDLKRMAIFSAVVEAESFSGAARRLGIAKSAVSKHVSLLEDSIGVRLLNRTTRKLSLTEAGERYYTSCARIVAEAEKANLEVRQLQDHLQGTLRLSCTIAFGTKHIVPVLHKFRQHHPELKIELLLDDNIVNIVDEAIDLAVRVGWPPESNLVARKLFEFPLKVVASPEYLQLNGTPKTPGELAEHNWIILSQFPSPQHFTFTHEGREQTVKMTSTFRTNNINAALALVLEGGGICMLANWLVDSDLESGRLLHLLPEYTTSKAGVYAVYPDRHHVPNKIRLFIDELAGHFSQV
ncbi:MAG TPA: LysR family transcriptional regulator [Gammaproteobacteria bacterium]|nr:LysR family transcriptional regulator [Gammaproteobacteria bacterium]